MNCLRTVVPCLLAAGCSAMTQAPLAPAPAPSQPLAALGIAWGMIYGPPATTEPARFMPVVRALGGGFTKVNLFWSQLEPEPGRYQLERLDAYLDQLAGPEEGVLALFSSSPWATRTAARLLPPSPAKDLDRYYRFVHQVVTHARGRIRYFQND